MDTLLIRVNNDNYGQLVMDRANWLGLLLKYPVITCEGYEVYVFAEEYPKDNEVHFELGSHRSKFENLNNLKSFITIVNFFEGDVITIEIIQRGDNTEQNTNIFCSNCRH